MDQKIIDFIKGLMQPALTMVAVVLLFVMSANGAFPAGDVFKVVVGIIIFWFGYTGIKNFTFTGNGKANGSTETTGTPPKANSGVSTAVADDVAADTWGGQGVGWNEQRVMNPVKAVVTDKSPSIFNRANFDRLVFDDAARNPVWNDGTACGLAQAAETAFMTIPTTVNLRTRWDAVVAMIDYTEAWFKELFFGDRNFNCVDASGSPITCIEYVRLHLKDGNAGCPGCGKDIQSCKPGSVEALAAYAGDNFHDVYHRLVNWYEWKAKLEAFLEN